jgi:YidC/Oxa1 family membrane protein insertase
MDKNTLIGIFLIGAILLTFTVLNNEEEPKNEVATTETIVKKDSISSNVEDSASVPASFSRTVKQDSIFLAQATDSIKLDSIAMTAYLDSMYSNLQNTSTSSQFENTYGIFAVNAGKVAQKEYFTLENDKIIVRFSNVGGRIVDVKLKEYQSYSDYIINNGDTIVPLQLFEEETSKQSLYFVADGLPISTDELMFETLNFKQVDITDTKDSSTIVFRLATNTANQYIDLRYTLKNGNYEVGFEVEYVNLQQVMDISKAKLNWEMVGLSTEKLAFDERTIATIMYRSFDTKRDYLSERSTSEEVFTGASINWVAFKTKFFTSALITEDGFNTGKVAQAQIEDDRYTILYKTEMVLPAKNIVKMKFFYGPNEYHLLASYNNGMEDIINLGWGIFGWVNIWFIQPVFDVLRSSGFAYGLIILLVTLAVKIVITPLTYKNYKSSAKMKVLKPEIERINEKYPGADQMLKRQQETQALYRSTGVNPLAGCLPMLIQMPILLAIFRFFPSSIHLRHEKFLWADDLSSYDAIASWAGDIPVLSYIYGNHISLFTLLMAGSTLWYTVINSANMATPQQPGMPNMKVIMYIFPFLMIFFFNSFSAGLSYYYLCGNLFNIAIMWGIKKFFIDEDKILATIEENKKKPVKKNKFMQRMEEVQKQQLEAKKKSKK